MAYILDSKTEVITVELTKHGRKQLASGNFAPEFYFFFDDSIIYDDSYSGNSTEDTNKIQERILEESINTSFLNLLDFKETISDNLIPLGRSDIFSEYAPAWNLSFKRGSITNNCIASIKTASTYYKKNIELNDIECKASLESTNLANFPMSNNSTYELEDGRVIIFDNDYILIELKEENVEDNYKNFDIELFTYDELYGGKEGGLKRKLTFTEKPSNIIEGILYDESELPQTFLEQDLTTNDVSYYLDVLVDDEIEPTIIAAAEQTVTDQIKPTYKQNVIEAPKEDC